MDKNTSVELAEIKKGVKDNGRNIADNSLRLMALDDKVGSAKDDIAEIKAMQVKYHEEAKEHYAKMDILFDELRKLVDKLNVSEVEVDRFKVGVV